MDLQAAEGESATRDAVRLMTIHASKGLEFPVVFLLGLTEGIFPSGKTLEERKQAGLEEERRLCYVALTRARQRLFLLDSEGFSENGGRKLPSRFLREIGTDNYNRIGAVPEELERASLAAARQGQNAPRKEERATGEAVEHPVFGRGIIIGRDEARGSYIVRFDKLDKPRHISRSFFEGPPRMPVLPAAPETAPERLPAPAEDADTAPPAPQPPEPVPKFKPVPEAVPEQEPTHSEPDGGIEIIPLDIEPTAPEAAPEKPRGSRTAGGENLWRRDDVPHSGWSCTGVSDLWRTGSRVRDVRGTDYPLRPSHDASCLPSAWCRLCLRRQDGRRPASRAGTGANLPKKGNAAQNIYEPHMAALPGRKRVPARAGTRAGAVSHQGERLDILF